MCTDNQSALQCKNGTCRTKGLKGTHWKPPPRKVQPAWVRCSRLPKAASCSPVSSDTNPPVPMEAWAQLGTVCNMKPNRPLQPTMPGRRYQRLHRTVAVPNSCMAQWLGSPANNDPHTKIPQFHTVSVWISFSGVQTSNAGLISSVLIGTNCHPIT